MRITEKRKKLTHQLYCWICSEKLEETKRKKMAESVGREKYTPYVGEREKARVAQRTRDIEKNVVDKYNRPRKGNIKLCLFTLACRPCFVDAQFALNK